MSPQECIDVARECGGMCAAIRNKSGVAYTVSMTPEQLHAFASQAIAEHLAKQQDSDSREAKKTIFWAISYDGKTPWEIFEDEDSAREEAMSIGGSCCAVPLVVAATHSKGQA